MEMVENGEQQMSVIIRHYCKVCNRGFGSAGALGGHMRAHVIGDLYNNGDERFGIKTQDNNNNISNNSSSNSNKHSYFLRAKTPRSFVGYQVSDDNQEDGEYKISSPFGKSGNSSEEEDLANCLVMLSSSNKSNVNSEKLEENNKGKEVEKGMFQCKACKKVFNSHQALGGHRASHKKVKGCFAAKLLDEENVEDGLIQEEDHELSTPLDHHHESDETQKRVCKMHECSVCRRVFTSGQALGGHKRCHWLTTSSSDNAFIPNFHYDQSQQQLYKKPDLDYNHHHHHQLDLNLNLNLKLENVAGHESTRLYLQQWASSANQNQQKIETTPGNEKPTCEMKLRKLSDLTDVNMDAGWLKVGIASTTDI